MNSIGEKERNFQIIYDFPPYRPPNEAFSALIRITRGCPWNKCLFCSMYKSLKFQMKSPEEIKKDVKEARRIYQEARTIFLGDSDNLVHPKLPEIVNFIREIFPEAQRISAYARANTIYRRKMSFLEEARKAGLNRLHIGFESGDALTLKRLGKGVNPEELSEAGRKAKEAGFEISLYVLSGAGGSSRWREHALESARVLNVIRPEFIRLRTLTVLQDSPLKPLMDKGEFMLTPPLQRLEEVLLLLEGLELDSCYLASDHLTNYLWVGGFVIYKGIEGNLPQKKGAMIKTLKETISFLESTEEEVKDSNVLYAQGFISSL